MKVPCLVHLPGPFKSDTSENTTGTYDALHLNKEITLLIIAGRARGQGMHIVRSYQ